MLAAAAAAQDLGCLLLGLHSSDRALMASAASSAEANTQRARHCRQSQVMADQDRKRRCSPPRTTAVDIGQDLGVNDTEVTMYCPAHTPASVDGSSHR